MEFVFVPDRWGVRADNDLGRYGETIGGSYTFPASAEYQEGFRREFYEADHLDGDVDMFSVVKEIVLLMKRRAISIPVRPDHGHQMLDDIKKSTYPGYSAIGRLRGIAELRGLEYGINKLL